MKIWKKEDFKDKYIYIDTKEKQERIEKFLEGLGFENPEWNKSYNPTNKQCFYLYVRPEINQFQYHNHISNYIGQIKYEDLQLDNKEIIFSIF